MSGHSKWSTIKRKKEAADSARARVFTKIGREISVCVKEGGGDPGVNSKLRDLIAKAKACNVPNENIERLLKKLSGGEDKNSYEAITYEGYGPGGVAVMVKTLTDNKNRTAGDLRHYFDKYGGNLGTTGCVSFMFREEGIVAAEDAGADEDVIAEDVLTAGGTDFFVSEGIVAVQTEPAQLSAVRDALSDKGYKILSADIEMIPVSKTAAADPEAAKKMSALLERLDDNDDVQGVYHNLDLDE